MTGITLNEIIDVSDLSPTLSLADVSTTMLARPDEEIALVHDLAQEKVVRLSEALYNDLEEEARERYLAKIDALRRVIAEAMLVASERSA